jgi:sulfatase maturation enzyme AslB (radical SAM superfamily)
MKSNDSKTFCMHPFTGLATREDGAVKICCRSLPIGWIQKQSLEEIWNNELMKDAREKILSSQRPDVCFPCFELEDQGVQSLRQRHITNNIPESRINLYPDVLDKLNTDYSMPFDFPTIEIKINNLCNLRCRMCNPLDSTQWKDWKEVESFYKQEDNYLYDTVNKLQLKERPYIGLFEDKDHFWSNLEKLLPYFRRVEFAGGEPLMDPNHFKILDMLSRYGENIEIKYATNGTVLGIKGGRTIFDYWPKFKSVAVNVSIDGIHDVYNHIRSNGNFEEVCANIQRMKEIPNVSRIVGAFTAQVGNILQTADVIEYFLDHLGIVFYSHRVSYPNILSAQVLPKALKDLAVDRLLKTSYRLHTFKNIQNNKLLYNVTKQQIQDNINYIWAKDQSDLWKDFVDFNNMLDESRNQGPLESIVKEFKPYV